MVRARAVGAHHRLPLQLVLLARDPLREPAHVGLQGEDPLLGALHPARRALEPVRLLVPALLQARLQDAQLVDLEVNRLQHAQPLKTEDGRRLVLCWRRKCVGRDLNACKQKLMKSWSLAKICARLLAETKAHTERNKRTGDHAPT